MTKEKLNPSDGFVLDSNRVVEEENDRFVKSCMALGLSELEAIELLLQTLD